MTTPLFAIALALLAGCSGGPAPAAPGAPPRLPSPAELATMGPKRAAEAMSFVAASHDLARLGAAYAAAETCPAPDDACRAKRKLEALEGFETSGEALRTLVALQRELAGPSGPRAVGPDDAGVYARLGLPPPGAR
ncbi:MAG TPA: hypothetical protein VFS43_38115 [Polyangiaceae bacterium]|nr:hypothetical protein [Polyangiaceae bacterium]